MGFSQRLGATFYTRVQDDLRAACADEELDALLTDDPDDVAYLTGFFHLPGERPAAVLVPRAGPVTLLVPELEREHAKMQQAAADLVAYPEYPGVTPPFEYLAQRVGDGWRVGVPGSMTLARRDAVGAACESASFVRSDILATARLVKLPEEIALHREAGRITDVMLAAGHRMVAHAVRDGGDLPSEAELAAHVSEAGTSTMYAEHDDVVVVSLLAGGLVYAGSNSSRPHALPSGYRLRPGDTFMLSLGCAVGGRFVEGERTFVLGRPTDDQRRYHDAVWRAQRTGAQALGPGVRCCEANRRCLDVIRAAGLDAYLRHRQGHGIGLGMHEPPWLEDGDDTVLREGMVVSNEPGIYVPGHAGYRISDSMLITSDGAEPLTSYPRSLDETTVAL